LPYFFGGACVNSRNYRTGYFTEDMEESA